MNSLAYRLPVALLAFAIGTASAGLVPRPPKPVRDSVAPVVVIPAHERAAHFGCKNASVRVDEPPASGGGYADGYSHHVYGDRLRDAGCYKEAAAAYEMAVARDRAYMHGYNDLTNTYNHLAWYEDAIKYARQGLEVNPSEAYLWNELGYASGSLNRYEEAAEAFQRAVRADPENAFAHASLGHIYFTLGRHERALAEAQQGGRLAIEASDDASLNTAAYTLLNLKHDEQSLAFFQKSVEISPGEVSNHTQLATTYLVLGREAEARATFRHALTLKANAPGEHLKRGWASLYLGDRQGAIAGARDYLERTNWKGHRAPYAVLLAYIAYKQSGLDAEAKHIVGDALVNCDASLWEQNFFRYLRNKLSASQLISSATNDEQIADARAIIGIDLLFRGKPTEAVPHLKWVKEHGERSDIAYPYFVRQLEELDSAGN